MASLKVPEIGALFAPADHLWKSGGRGFEDFVNDFEGHTASDVQFRVIGQEFQLKYECVGTSGLRDYVMSTLQPTLAEVLDTNKPMERTANPIVVGGPNEWTVVEMKATGTSKKGKQWNHESLILLKKNLRGKWCEVRIYMDTLHLQNHIVGGSK